MPVPSPSEVKRILDPDEIGRRKQLARDLWQGKPLDHVPYFLVVAQPEPAYSVREQFMDAEKQLEVALSTALLSFSSVPEGDYIPAMRPDVGCSCLATAFGSELYWGESTGQTCGVKEPIIADAAKARDIEVPPPDAGILGEGIRRVGMFAEAGQGLVSVSLLDMAGGLNVAMDLLGGERLYLSMYEEPQALELLLEKIQKLFLSTVNVQIRAAGGEANISTTDFPDIWFPEGRKGHVSDDISANISPALYRRFSLPCHDIIFGAFGGGGLHNCGPNPCLEEYFSHTPAPRSLDLSWRYSRVDFTRIKEVCGKKAIVYLADFPVPVQDLPGVYEEIARAMAPDVLVVPQFTITTKDEPAGLDRRLRAVSEQYAREMSWGWVSQ